MKNCINVVECAIQKDDKFLVIRRPNGVHAGGLLSFPGGKVEEEDAQEDSMNVLRTAVIREVFEEVGITLLDEIKYITTSFFKDDNDIPIMNNVFHCILIKTGSNVVASPREAPEYFWLTRDQILADISAPIWLKDYIKLI